MIEKFLKKRREKLAEKLENNELVIIYAASAPSYPRYFLQDNNFLYFTDLQIPDAIIMFYKMRDKVNCKLFIERGIPELVVWEGAKLPVEEAKKLSGIENVHYLDQFDWHLSHALMGAKNVYLNIKVSSLQAQLKKQHKLSQEIKQTYPYINVFDTTALMSQLRSVKDEIEIERMKTAIDHTRAGVLAIMQQAETGMMEYELEALLQYEIMRRGNRHMGFKSIIASGKNAATLHYAENNCRIGKQDLILLDVGGSHQNYSADISRTFPIAGKFTKRQQEVYREVLAINKAIIQEVKQGASLVKLNEKTVELITEALFRLKLIKDKKEYRKYYMHSVSHHLGMDTHDLGSRDSVLEPGNIITVEPGIYIPEEKIGVRIEDDILVTKAGMENLSSLIPKEVDELLDTVNQKGEK